MREERCLVFMGHGSADKRRNSFLREKSRFLVAAPSRKIEAVAVKRERTGIDDETPFRYVKYGGDSSIPDRQGKFHVW